MALEKTRQIPLGTYPNGTRSFGPFATPRGLDQFDIRVGRCTSADSTVWPNASTILRVDAQFSFDDGLSYTPIGENRFEQGGGIIEQHGVEQAESVITFGPVLNGKQPTNFKVQITVSGGPIRTYLDATVLT